MHLIFQVLETISGALLDTSYTHNKDLINIQDPHGKIENYETEELDGNIDANENIDQNRITSTPAFTLRILQDNKIF